MFTSLNNILKQAYFVFRNAIAGNRFALRGMNNSIDVGDSRLQKTIFDIKGNNNSILVVYWFYFGPVV